MSNENKREFEEIPTGFVYVVSIDSVEECESKGGRPMVKVVYKVAEGKFKNQRIWRYQLRDTEVGEEIAKRIIKECRDIDSDYAVLAYMKNAKGYETYRILGVINTLWGAKYFPGIKEE